MATKFKVDGSAIRQLAEILVDTKLTEIEYEDEGGRIRVSRNGPVAQTATVVAHEDINSVAPSLSPPPVAPEAPKASSHPTADPPGAIKSPMVGTAYLCAEPGAAPFVRVGDTVTEGQTLLIVEAMKVMNPIKSPQAGKITHIFAKDGVPVEFGELLMVIE